MYLRISLCKCKEGEYLTYDVYQEMDEKYKIVIEKEVETRVAQGT